MSRYSLIGNLVVLRPLAREDAAALVAAARDQDAWRTIYTQIPAEPAAAEAYIEAALRARDMGESMPFATTLREDGRVVGSTRYCRIEPAHRKREIGYTWIGGSWQRTFVNTEAKYLMLRHAFEGLGCQRVQLQTDELNQQSRRAIERLGARLEGILRNDRIMPDGRRRHSAMYSIVDEEWPRVRAGLEAAMRRRGLEPAMEVAEG